MRALRYATIAVFIAAGFEALEHLIVLHLASWPSHVAAILAWAILVFFLVASAGFPGERNKAQQFSETDQHVQNIMGRAQDAITENESRYRWLFENMLEGCAYCKMLFDDRGSPIDFVYLDVNGAFGKLTGLANVVGTEIYRGYPWGQRLAPRTDREIWPSGTHRRTGTIRDRN